MRLLGGIWGSSLILAATASAAPAHFVDVAKESGLAFEHVNGMVGKRWLVEIMGSGAGVFDFDGDGRLDVWLVQGGPLADRDGVLPCDRLFRNVGRDGALRFEDATSASGICSSGYGMGIATGDIDNDGDLDAFVANYGANALYENIGGGRFRDITASAGIVGDAWSVSASFADVDGDGLLDLYVANYVAFSLDAKHCTSDRRTPSYCLPVVYPDAADKLYRNLGGRRFVDVSAAAGVGAVRAAAMGVVAEDFDGDGNIDFYVANDMHDNLLWMNDGAGAFSDRALLAGAAVNGDGMVEASMGVAAEDFDQDCDIDLFMTHLAVQTNTLYVNDGEGWFTDKSNAAGVAASSFPYTGFGTAWFDADNDGDLDLFSANGAVADIAGQAPGLAGLALRQPNQFWLNDGRGRYTEARDVPALAVEEVSRGAAFGDLDNDGDLDIVVMNNRGPARLYRNDAATAHWLGVELAAAGGVAGARVWMEGRRCRGKRATTDGSYASANDLRLLFGLGGDSWPKNLVVRWPDGEEQRFGPLAVDRYHLLRRR